MSERERERVCVCVLVLGCVGDVLVPILLYLAWTSAVFGLGGLELGGPLLAIWDLGMYNFAGLGDVGA